MNHTLKGSIIRIVVCSSNGEILEIKNITACSTSHFRAVVEKNIFFYSTTREALVKCSWLQDGFYIVVYLTKISSYGNKKD